MKRFEIPGYGSNQRFLSVALSAPETKLLILGIALLM